MRYEKATIRQWDKRNVYSIKLTFFLISPSIWWEHDKINRGQDFPLRQVLFWIKNNEYGTGNLKLFFLHLVLSLVKLIYDSILHRNKTKYFKLRRYDEVWLLSVSLIDLWLLFKYYLSAFWVFSECLLNALWVILKSSWSLLEDMSQK